MLQPHKPALADAILAMTMESSDVTARQGELQFVLDGGALIYRIPWSRGSTYRNICELHCKLCGPEVWKWSLSLMDTQVHPQEAWHINDVRRESRCDRHIYWRHETYNEEGSLSGKQNQ